MTRRSRGSTRSRSSGTPTAFAACGALQCGFCTPGIVVRTKALIDKKGAGLTRDEAARHLGAHLCRCTGYVKILDAIEALARGDDPRGRSLPGGVGTRGIKYEGRELAVGPTVHRRHPVPGMLHGALRLTDHARADVVEHRHLGGARPSTGVVAVFTAADVPGELRVGIIHKDWPVFIPEGGRTSYLGDVLAIVVADDRATARRAAELVEVDYGVLRPITDPVASHRRSRDAVWGYDGNVLSRSTYRRGDVDAALERAAHVVHEVFQTPRIEHAFLEPESTLAVPTRRRAACTSTPAVRASGTTATRSPACSASIAIGRDRRAGVQRRRLRRQGGHVEPGADRARRRGSCKRR